MQKEPKEWWSMKKKMIVNQMVDHQKEAVPKDMGHHVIHQGLVIRKRMIFKTASSCSAVSKPIQSTIGHLEADGVQRSVGNSSINTTICSSKIHSLFVSHILVFLANMSNYDHMLFPALSKWNA
jgi:hypothetical protein